MEIKEFLKQKKRMCDYYTESYDNECKDCPLYEYDDCGIDSPFVTIDEDVDNIVNIVVDWNEKHPVKTRQSVMLELFPNIEKKDDLIALCPKSFDTTLDVHCEKLLNCRKCREDFWLKEVK